MTLPQRIEAAEGADRALDVAIALASGGINAIGADILWPSGFRMPCPRYTASLDAALTLVPDGLVFNLGNDASMCWAHVWDDVPEYDGEPYEGRAATPALALCAAALKAHIERNEG